MIAANTTTRKENTNARRTTRCRGSLSAAICSGVFYLSSALACELSSSSSALNFAGANSSRTQDHAAQKNRRTALVFCTPLTLRAAVSTKGALRVSPELGVRYPSPRYRGSSRAILASLPAALAGARVRVDDPSAEPVGHRPCAALRAPKTELRVDRIYPSRR
jgi:hypothetical protein